MIGSAAVSVAEPASHASLDELVSDVERPLYRYLLAMVRDDNLALDCVQDAFLRAHESVRAGRPVNRQWIFTVARNRAIDELRRRRRVHCDNESIERAAISEKTDQSLTVRQALSRLDPLDAEVLVLFTVHGYRTDEIGERLGVSGAAIRQRLYRARERFRRVYQEDRSAAGVRHP